MRTEDSPTPVKLDFPLETYSCIVRLRRFIRIFLLQMKKNGIIRNAGEYNILPAFFLLA